MPAITILRILVSFLLAAPLCLGADLVIFPEAQRSDPFGRIVASDRPQLSSSIHTENFHTARAGYVSFHVVAKFDGPSEYRLDLDLADTGGKIQIEVFREWYHLAERDHGYYPDALVPVHLPYRSTIPEPDNRIANQHAQAFWVDIWVPADAKPGRYLGHAKLQSGSPVSVTPFVLNVLAARFPDQDVVTIDHNSYGTSWIADLFPKAAAAYGDAFLESDVLFDLIHKYHRIFYEHRGIFHQLGYGHGGKVSPEFAPRLEGSGRKKHVLDWELFDRHYSALLDGSAFAGTHRGVRPIPFVYLPINPEWPASLLWWGEPGYETEFTNVVSEMARHFREKGWTGTRFEMFFNQKKRYMGFPWDGDEVRFSDDNRYLAEYGRLLKKSLDPDSPVQFIFRADVSWDMARQFRDLRGVVRLWVANGEILSWHPEAPAMLRQRGDTVWYYGSPPAVSKPSAAITRFALQAWLWGVNGYVHWLAVSPGADPWFHFEDGETALVYPGERFGVEGPIPSIRLKLERNCLQDLALLDSFKTKRPLATLKREAASRFNRSKPEDWWNPMPDFAKLPPSQWRGSDIDAAVKKTRQMTAAIDAGAWDRVHEFVLSLAAEEK